MVQYIVTPWRDHTELISVRDQLYPNADAAVVPGDNSFTSSDGAIINSHASSSSSVALSLQRTAVARVQMWVHRGNCPHLIESTGLLVAVVLDDLDQANARRANAAAASSASSDFGLRAAYATAFSRFVTGLLDSQQDKQKKQSMYSLAKTIGLPATFVELRHQATHEQLPSLLKLRSAAKKALAWIWDFYWKHLPPATTEVATMQASQVAVEANAGGASNDDDDNDDDDGADEGGEDAAGADGEPSPSYTCEQVLLDYLRRKIDERTARLRLAPFEERQIATAADDISNTTDDTRVMVRALQLVGDIVEGGCPLITARDKNKHKNKKEPAPTRTAATTGPASSARERNGWSRRPKSLWRPKPMGVV